MTNQEKIASTLEEIYRQARNAEVHGSREIEREYIRLKNEAEQKVALFDGDWGAMAATVSDRIHCLLSSGARR